MRTDKDSDGKSKPAGKPGKVGTVDDAAFRGYINVDLTADEKARYPSWAVPETVFAVFEAAVACGVNVSVKRERKVDGFLASATQRDPGSVNAGLCVTARAKEAVSSFGRLMFILDILTRSESWEDTAPMANPDRW